MFNFKPTNKTYSDPVSAIFRPGVPFGRDYAKGDICLLHDRIPGSKIFLNSKILREAMLDSAEFLEEALEIKIIDTRKEPKKQPEVIEKPSEPTPEPAEEAVPSEDSAAVDNLIEELEDKPKKKTTKK